MVFQEEYFLVPLVIESNRYEMVGAYHLHVEYGDEDHHETTPTKNDSLDMAEESSLHAENNYQHLPQSFDMMTCFAKFSTKEGLGDN